MITILLGAAGHGALRAARALPFAAPLLGGPGVAYLGFVQTDLATEVFS